MSREKDISIFTETMLKVISSRSNFNKYETLVISSRSYFNKYETYTKQYETNTKQIRNIFKVLF